MKKQTYTPEIKERAVRILIEAAGDYPSTWSAIPASVQTQSQEQRIKEPERENKDLKQANKKKASALRIILLACLSELCCRNHRDKLSFVSPV